MSPTTEGESPQVKGKLLIGLRHLFCIGRKQTVEK